MFQSPGDTAFTLGHIDIYYYGIIMACAIVSGIFVIIKTAKKFFLDINSDTILDISFLLIIWGILGARIYYVLADYDYFLKFPFEILAVRNGGISIQGAIIGGIIAGIFYVRKHKLNFFKYADLFVFGLVTVELETDTDLPWKLFIPYNNRPLEFRNYEFFHPAFLYESLLNIIVLIILYTILIKYKKRKNGFIFFSYIILYSLVRIIVESVRIDSVLNIHGIHIAHIASALFIIIALISLFFLHKTELRHFFNKAI